MNYNFSKIIDPINSFLSTDILWNSLWRIILAVVLFFAVFFWLKFIMKVVHNKIEKYTKDKKRNFWIIFLNSIKNISKWFFIALEIYIPLKILNLPTKLDFAINIIFFFVLTIQLIQILVKILTFSLSWLFKKKNIKEDKTTKKTIHMIVNIVVWIIGILMFLTNVGINLTPLVASLWVASIAIAFALQNILSDLFSSFSIIFSKPFNVWDYVIVWEWSTEKAGVVKDINFKATHLLTISWQEVVIPNTNILSTEIINYGRMTHRRKRFSIGVTYETTQEKLEKIPEIIKKVIDDLEFATYEWTYLSELAPYSINFLISYDIQQPDYIVSLDIQEKVIFGIIKVFEKEGIEFAYPTQKIHMENVWKK